MEVTVTTMTNSQCTSSSTAIVSGWGTLGSWGLSTPNKLMEVTVTTMTNSQCTSSSTAYSSSDITGRMICAAAPGKDSCQGDSGGDVGGIRLHPDRCCVLGSG